MLGLCCLTGVASAAPELVVQPRRGSLVSGAWNAVYVAIHDDGRLSDRRPDFQIEGGVLGPIRDDPRGGYWLEVLPSSDTLTLRSGDAATRLPVRQTGAGPLTLEGPRRALTSARQLRFLIAHERFPLDREWLQVSSSEGGVVVEEVPEGLAVNVLLEDDPLPREVVLMVSDGRLSTEPMVARVQVDAVVRMPVQVPPGTQVTATVGRRDPVSAVAGDDGRAVLQLRHGHRDTVAQLELVTPDGARTTRPVSLSVSGRRPWVVHPGPPLGLGRERSHVHVFTSDTEAAPTCRALPDTALDPQDQGDGLWTVALPAGRQTADFDERVVCFWNGEQRTGTVRALPAQVRGLQVTAWPEELSVDLPIADLRAQVMGPADQPLSVEGRLRWSTLHGRIEEQGGQAGTFSAVYSGLAAVEIGEDVVSASWYAPFSDDTVARIDLQRVDSDGTWAPTFSLRAVDGQGRGVAGVNLRVSLAGETMDGVTTEGGWFTFGVSRPLSPGAHRLDISSPLGRERLVVFSHHTQGRHPGDPDAYATQPIFISRGRGARIFVESSPTLLRAWPGRAFELRAELRDREGGVVSGASTLELRAGELEIEETSRTDEAVTWTVRPKTGTLVDDTVASVRQPGLDIVQEVPLSIRPRQPRFGFGVSAGYTTNFMGIHAPLIQAGADFLFPIGGRATRTLFFARAGAGWFPASVRALADDGELVEQKASIVPLQLGTGIRYQSDRHGVYLLVAGQLPFYAGQTWKDGEFQTSSGGVFSPAVLGLLGYGLRNVTGEVYLEVGGSSLNAQGVQDVPLGLLGGLNLSLGYRVLY